LQSRFHCQHIADADNLARLSDTDLNELASSDCVVVCKTDELEENIGTRMFSAAARWYQQNALIIFSTSLHTLGDPSLDDFEDQLGFLPLHIGMLPDIEGERPQLVALYDRDVQDAFAAPFKALPRPLAIMSAFNEEDVIREVIEDLLEQGCEVIILDNWSTDGTWKILQTLQHTFVDRLTVERFPKTPVVRSSWVDILARKEEIALLHPGRWIIHADADELRRSPFSGVDLAHAMYAAQSTGEPASNLQYLIFVQSTLGHTSLELWKVHSDIFSSVVTVPTSNNARRGYKARIA
jgi:hypothetical protein